jgi:26S proteasome regulatory subunit N12
MPNADLTSILKRIHTCLSHRDYTTASTLLTKAKLALLSLNALVPHPTTPQPILILARETLELGALTSIRQQDPEGFTRYVQQLQPFYDLPSSRLPSAGGNKSKITGLYLLLLLSQGDYAGFHTLLEALEVSEDGRKFEEDVFIQYPVKLEQWLMEGSYDKVWAATKSERVPSEEYGVFSEVGLPICF